MSAGIQQLYSQIPKTYELLNHILTFGADVVWRKKALSLMPQPVKGIKCLDICTGTGDMARLLSKRFNHNAIIVGADFSYHMLKEAIKKSGQGIRYINTEAKTLPFKDNSFDLVTITFATRNLRTSETHLKECLSEIHRVLKPEGIFIHLETSQPASPAFRWLFHRYVKIFIKPVGGLISGSYKAYAYLSRTIPCFYTPKEFSKIIYESGFSHVEYTKLWGGIAAIHNILK
jgi:demethylmenaquinone methyltransferase/2-methoxy-6-polyprenyl-1,4-benzoquinol methylase